MQMNMGLRCNMTSITEIGDKLLTAYVDGDYQEVLDLWVSVGDSTERTVELHKYSNPNITRVKLGMAVVDAVKSLKSLKNKES